MSNNKVMYETLDDFHAGCIHFMLAGIRFDAYASTKTIHLLGH